LGAELPSPNTKRWVVRRKAAVVAAVRAGVITLQEVYRRYQLSEEEFLAWQRAFEAHGPPGLRSTRVQQYHNLRSLGPLSDVGDHRGNLANRR
jgi:endonuclease/exonuclease/phosphatase family metal-dependent hydrolase